MWIKKYKHKQAVSFSNNKILEKLTCNAESVLADLVVRTLEVRVAEASARATNAHLES